MQPVRLLRVSSAGGTPQPLSTLAEGETTQRWPEVLPGGKAVTYSSAASANTWEDANIVVQPLPAGERKIVQRGGYRARSRARDAERREARQSRLHLQLLRRTAMPGAGQVTGRPRVIHLSSRLSEESGEVPPFSTPLPVTDERAFACRDGAYALP